MKKMRQDAWSKEEDKYLAETVLKHIRDGHTQLEAFKRAASGLQRTPAACGYRWNATIRQTYTDAIKIAKSEQQQPVVSQIYQEKSNDTETIDSVIMLLEQVKSDRATQGIEKAAESIAKLKEENKYLQDKIKYYEDAWREMGKLWQWTHNNNIKTKEH